METNQYPTNQEKSTPDIISDILTKYGLQESEEELVKKFFDEPETTHGASVAWIASKLSSGEKTDEEALIILKDNLHTSEQTAKQILGNIKTTLLPLFKKNQNAEATPVHDLPKTFQPEKLDIPEKPAPPRKQSQRAKAVPSFITKEEIPGQNKKNDTYREPIE